MMLMKVLWYAGLLLLLLGVALRLAAKTLATPWTSDLPRMDSYAQLVGTGWIVMGVGAFLLLLAFVNRSPKRNQSRR